MLRDVHNAGDLQPHVVTSFLRHSIQGPSNSAMTYHSGQFVVSVRISLLKMGEVTF